MKNIDIKENNKLEFSWDLSQIKDYNRRLKGIIIFLIKAWKWKQYMSNELVKSIVRLLEMKDLIRNEIEVDIQKGLLSYMDCKTYKDSQIIKENNLKRQETLRHLESIEKYFSKYLIWE